MFFLSFNFTGAITLGGRAVFHFPGCCDRRKPVRGRRRPGRGIMVETRTRSSEARTRLVGNPYPALANKKPRGIEQEQT